MYNCTMYNQFVTCTFFYYYVRLSKGHAMNKKVMVQNMIDIGKYKGQTPPLQNFLNEIAFSSKQTLKK